MDTKETDRVVTDDLYHILGVPHTAPISEIKRAFRLKAKAAHPDKGGDPKAYAALQHAYEILSDGGMREHYDRTGRPEKSAEEDFLEIFYARKGAAPAAPENVLAFADRITTPKDQSHTSGFEEWLRARDLSNATIDDDYIRENVGVTKAAYQPVPNPCSHPPSKLKRISLSGSRAQRATTSDFVEIAEEKMRRELEWGEILVNMSYSPITPRDATAIRLGEDILSSPKAEAETGDSTRILGAFGIGQVAALGPGTKCLKERDLVIPLREDLGTWQTAAIWRERDLLRLPADLLPIEYAASTRELFLAYHLLQQFAGDLKPGDGILISGANSLVGRLLIQFAKLIGIRTIAVVRYHCEEIFRAASEKLFEMGASRVFRSDAPIKVRLQKERLALPLVAFDCLLGSHTTPLVNALADNGRLVLFGNLSSQPLAVPWHLLIGKDLTIKSFHLTRWLEKASNQQKMLNALESISKLLASKKLNIGFKEFRLWEYKAALNAFSEPGRTYTPLFKFSTLAEEAEVYEKRKENEEVTRQQIRQSAETLFAPEKKAAPPAFTPNMLDFITTNSKGKDKTTLVFLHHCLEAPEEYEVLFQRLANRDDAFTNTRICLPEGPARQSIAGEELSAWAEEKVDILFSAGEKTEETTMSDADILLLSKLENTCNILADTIEKQIYKPGCKLILSGFHTGALIALLTALTKLTVPVTGVICLGLPEMRSAIINFLGNRAEKKTNIFLLSGSNDNEISQNASVNNQSKMNKAGFDLVTAEHIPQGTHQVGEEELAHLSAVLSLI